MPYGSKKDIQIPQEIIDNNQWSKRCLCGIFDTDFHITSNLSISGKIHSVKVAEQIHKILTRNNIQHVFRSYPHYGRFYIPKNEAFKIVFDWKMNNIKHLTKFEVFNKFKLYLPFTTTSERLHLLDGRIDLEYLEKIGKYRKNKTIPRGLEPRTS